MICAGEIVTEGSAIVISRRSLRRAAGALIIVDCRSRTGRRRFQIGRRLHLRRKVMTEGVGCLGISATANRAVAIVGACRCTGCSICAPVAVGVRFGFK